jgi:Domain of unknown function (DUF5122) beta-propeller
MLSTKKSGGVLSHFVKISCVAFVATALSVSALVILNRSPKVNAYGGDTSYSPGLLQNIPLDFKVSKVAYQATTDKYIIAGQFGKTMYRVSNDGTIDNTFNVGGAGFGNNDSVYDMVIDTSGNIYAGGSISKYNGLSIGKLIKLDPNGRLNLNYNPIPSGGIVYSLAINATGKLYVGGSFSVNGRNNFTRIDAMGQADTTFMMLGDVDGSVNKIVFDTATSKVYIGGSFSNYNATPIGKFLRFNEDGTQDMTCVITTGASQNITSMGINSNSIYYTANTPPTTTPATVPTYNSVAVKNVVKLSKSNCTLDTAFNSVDLNAYTTLSDIAFDGTGNLVVAGGGIKYYNPTNGSVLSGGFNLNAVPSGSNIRTLLKTSGNEIIYGGDFSNNGLGFESRYAIGKLTSAGAIVTSFKSNELFPFEDPNYSIPNNTPLLYNGKYYLVISNASYTSTIIRLNSDLTRDNTFTSPAFSYYNKLAVNTNGKILTNDGLNFKLFNADGTLNATIAHNGTVEEIIADGTKFLIGGNNAMTSYNGVANSVKALFRVNEDLTLDATFNTALQDVTKANVFTHLAKFGTKYYVAGKILEYGTDTTVGNILRLNNDGTIDTTFAKGTGLTPSINTDVFAMTVDNSGNLVIFPRYSNTFYYNGVLKPGPTASTSPIIRILANGTLDTTFNSNTLAAKGGLTKYGISLSDGTYLFAQGGNSIEGATGKVVAHILANGALDPNFTTMPTGAGSTILPFSNGYVLLSGSISSTKKILAFTMESETVAPTITGITVTNAPGASASPQKLGINVTFSEKVTITTPLVLNLNTGRSCTIPVTTLGANSETCLYSIDQNDDVTTAEITSITGTIRDTAIVANTTSTFPISSGNNIVSSAITILPSAAQVTSITSTSSAGTYKATNPVNITLNFSLDVQNLAPVTVNLNSGGTCIIAISASYRANPSCTYTPTSAHYAAGLEVTSVVGSFDDLDEGNNTNPSLLKTAKLSATKAIVIAPDTDNDGVSDHDEAAGPNSGDSNGDGTPDSTQSSVVSSMTKEGTPTAATLSTSTAGVSISELTTLTESTLSISDSANDFTKGLFAFKATGVTAGGTIPVEIILDKVYTTTNWKLRHFNRTTNVYSDVAATFGSKTVGGTAKTTITYNVTDGGPLDEDGVANGTIIDPVGISTPTNSLVTTGNNILAALILVAIILAGTLVMKFAKKNKTK